MRAKTLICVAAVAILATACDEGDWDDEPVDERSVMTPGGERIVEENPDSVYLDAVEDPEAELTAPSGAQTPRAIGTCTRRSDIVNFAGTGEKVNYAPDCTASEELAGGGCNTDTDHAAHTWLLDTYAWDSNTWRCSMYHNNSDDADLGAYAQCCT